MIIFLIVFLVITPKFYAIGGEQVGNYNSKNLPALITKTVQENKNPKELIQMLMQYQQEQKNLFRGRSESSADLLKEALTASESNLKIAEKNTHFFGNTSRMFLAGSGVIEILFGASKAGYDFFSFSDEETDTTANIFNVIADAALVRTGIYSVKLACKNGSAQAEYNQAIMAHSIIGSIMKNQSMTNETLKELEDLPEEVIPEIEINVE